jgi:hypothetical protein
MSGGFGGVSHSLARIGWIVVPRGLCLIQMSNLFSFRSAHVLT